MTHLLLAIGIMIIFSCQGFATAQIPDFLIYRGDTLKLFANPLEQLPGIDSLRSKFFGKELYTTACWRGYQAQWIFIENELYLDNIYDCSSYSKIAKADLKKFFGARCINGRVKADWVNANLLSPQGKLLFYMHGGYESIYEKELEFQVKKGLLFNVLTYDNSKSQKSVYSNNDALAKFIYSHINWPKLPKDSTVARVIVQFSANENGIVDQLKIVRGYDETYDQEALRVVKAIPQWDVYYRHGEHFRLLWNLPIHFSIENRKKYSP